ncbi:MAG: hypothetical protein M3337_06750 [Actinomycetota bacterium]|nr:hypothetical protein [Actinomycetota bacterium]
MVDDCLICRKHSGEGPLVAPVIWSDEIIELEETGERLRARFDDFIGLR